MAVLNVDTKSVGWEAEGFMLPGTDGNSYMLKDFTDKKGVLVIFSCNHCPYAKAHWPIFNDLYKKFRADINFLAINPNDEVAYPEDSFEVMQEKVKEWNIEFPYLRDETQEIATKYDAKSTPDAFLFKTNNNEVTLFYRGKIVDNWDQPEKAEHHYLSDAMQDLIEGKEPPKDQPVAVGCTIKWK